MAEARKTVTIVFSDVSGSTALGEQTDPETMRRIMERYFKEMRSILERHGGTVEKFIGDAVMAVFGIPRVHEDDALRAVRAAAEMRDRLAALNEEFERERGVTIAVRTGVNTGEVVAGDPEKGQAFATGDAVNVAARLEQAASPGEILLGETTSGLVRDAVATEPLDLLTLRGKASGVSACRFLELREEAPSLIRRADSPLVGRRAELARLEDAFKQAVDDQRPVLTTVLGPPGIGKSRLAAELMASLQKRATVLAGRCLSYGEGITFWPIAEIVRALKEEAELASLVDERVEAAVGLSDVVIAGEEAFWSIRKLFEGLAQRHPLALVFEDIHWAEPTLLDLVEHVVEWTQDAPMLVLCLARPEFAEGRPSWPGERMTLAPLDDREAETLMDNLLRGARLPEGTRSRIADAAGGNPLFVEQLLAMVAQNGHGEELRIPATIQALMDARLDALPAAEREVLERASVVGKEFWRSAVVALSPPATSVTALLQHLVRGEFVLPEKSLLPNEDGFRFRHILIRDAAYSRIPKEARSELHTRFADWLQTRSDEFEEIVGYHLEQAHRYRAELGLADTHTEDLAQRAAETLGAVGLRASERGDMSAAANLLGRASALLRPGDPARADVLVALGIALYPVGDFSGALAVLSEAVAEAALQGDVGLQWRAMLERTFVESQREPGVSLLGKMIDEADQAIPSFEQLGDNAGLARAWRARGQALYWGGQLAEGAAAAERAVNFASRAGDRREEALGLRLFVGTLEQGPAPARDVVRACGKLLDGLVDNADLEAAIRRTLGTVHAMDGRFEEARTEVDRAVETYEELGLTFRLAATLGFNRAFVHLEQGDVGAAERDLRRACALLSGLGEKGGFSTLAGQLADVLELQDRCDESREFVSLAEAATAPDDWLSVITTKTVRARLLARESRFGEAVALAREAIATADETDCLDARASHRFSLGGILSRAGDVSGASQVLEEAAALWTEKGNRVEAARARRALAELQSVGSPSR